MIAETQASCYRGLSQPDMPRARNQAPLTGTDFFHYIHCPHWPYWDRFGDLALKRERTAEEEQRIAGGLEHEKDMMRSLSLPLKTSTAKTAETGFRQTLAWMQEGVPLIAQGWLVDGDWHGRPDLLLRVEGQSVFGDWFYVPLDIKQAHTLQMEHKAQLMFYAVLLERIQKRFPSRPGILNGDHVCLSFDAELFYEDFHDMLQELERIRAGECPDPVYRKACDDISPWGHACFRLAKDRSDIALLYNVNRRDLKSLRQLGVSTVEQAAQLDPLALEGQAPGLTAHSLERIRLQAQSLVHGRVVIREPYEEVCKGLEIHFDIESHPPTDTDYLFGFWIREPGHERYHTFLAERPEDEEQLWRAFLAWLPTLPAEYTVYHYASFEITELRRLSLRYGDAENPWLARFVSRCVDLQKIARTSIVFPIYFYSLKKIAKFLGFSWNGEIQNGGASVLMYDQWRTTGDRAHLNSILQYNEEDVRATAWLLDWLRAYSKAGATYQAPFPWEGSSRG